MESNMVEENGNSSLDPLGGESASGHNNTDDNSTHQSQQSQLSSALHHHQPQQQHQQQQQDASPSGAVLATSANIVQFIPTQSVQAQSVIQANQSSVIQTAANLQPLLGKGVLYVNKGNSVIHTAPGIQVQIKPEPHSLANQVHATDTNSDNDSMSDDDSLKRRRDLLTRRPSYHRILKDITGPDIAVLPTSALQIAGVQSADGLHAIQTGGSGGTIVQYAAQNPDGQFFVPAEDQSRKREIRLQKNREAARECRRKKKEYIKCLENRVAVLENQNKALIEELKSLKELYCQQKTD
ncbi:cyclic AMP response element-binding protein B isoform X3 [Sitodiplosis mosellana]|uniref:cyclic AMP response element-binding protein B isoform X3 n=1 Tax=Sitodiplosis mosellana TaxID=263140 RepID=UPI00244507CD|nr:cyclic AMP response element-binding protein B isoform X3 [Sitodiplosis mosellana]XP_055303581.1 cyclic AMP response element-binding protein B isoform X3 [Sitodiplosis mosellana]XP_055303583.1 cyclic AMP response element-binding protein B isoform X3 [Sitodiplosis mosellana]XP_055303584.1 cyclic AMP response element-binding protein B isoform X3 [Sitodiplosis mosellana]XP_055303585.1 cyclic AMP response element-binding protein B isoform X3 [Sitodiplosis mosellana]XP_055303586.1 cyclic AMP resp